jgi:hypothetical protein
MAQRWQWLRRFSFTGKILVVVKDLAAIFAMVCVGIWALYTFEALNSSELADADLKAKELEFKQLEITALKQQEKLKLEVKRLQQETEYAPLIDIDISAQVIYQDKINPLVELKVVLSNKGKLKEILNLEQKPLRIYPVVFKECSNCLNTPVNKWMESNLQFPNRIKAVSLLPGGSQTFRTLYKPAMHDPPRAQTYYIEFAVALSQKSLQQWKDYRNISDTGQYQWVEGVYLEVPPPKLNP